MNDRMIIPLQQGSYVNALMIPDLFPAKGVIRQQMLTSVNDALEHHDPLDLYCLFKGMEIGIKEAVDNLKEGAMSSFGQKYGGVTKESHRGVEVSFRRTGVDTAVWEYPEDVRAEMEDLEALENQLLSLTDEIKAQKEVVKAKQDQAKKLKTAKLLKKPKEGHGQTIVVSFKG